MLALTRQEKAILIFLSLSLVTGLSVSAYKKSQGPCLKLDIRPYKPIRQQAEKLIQQHRFININSSKIEELTRLPGIGEKIAERIIEYQKIHGLFTAKEELLNVNGIGKKKFEQIKDSIILE